MNNIGRGDDANRQTDSAGSVDPGLRAANRCKTWSSREPEGWESGHVRGIDARRIAYNNALGSPRPSLRALSVTRRIWQADSYHGPEGEAFPSLWEPCRIYDRRIASGLMDSTYLDGTVVCVKRVKKNRGCKSK